MEPIECFHRYEEALEERKKLRMAVRSYQDKPYLSVFDADQIPKITRKLAQVTQAITDFIRKCEAVTDENARKSILERF